MVWVLKVSATTPPDLFSDRIIDQFFDRNNTQIVSKFNGLREQEYPTKCCLHSCQVKGDFFLRTCSMLSWRHCDIHCSEHRAKKAGLLSHVYTKLSLFASSTSTICRLRRTRLTKYLHIGEGQQNESGQYKYLACPFYVA